MIANDSQRVRICKALARAAHHERLIGEQRPTEEFFDQVANPTCSAGEWLLLSTAHAVWTGSKVSGPTVGLMLCVLDDKGLTLVGELLQALAARDHRPLEAWLTRAGLPAPVPAGVPAVEKAQYFALLHHLREAHSVGDRTLKVWGDTRSQLEKLHDTFTCAWRPPEEKP
jgi:hypothetical protein